MGVLYSMFQVLVCDEVPEGVASYSDSGWCFSELMTASLGGQLAVFSPEWAAGSQAPFTSRQTAFQSGGAFDIDDLLDAVSTELRNKVFREEGVGYR